MPGSAPAPPNAIGRDAFLQNLTHTTHVRFLGGCGSARGRTYPTVSRIEQVLPARLPLTARQRAKRIETAGDGRDEAPLAAAIGGDGAEHRRRRLMRAVGAAKPLDGTVRPPARLKQEVHPALLVLGVEAGMIRAAGEQVGAPAASNVPPSWKRDASLMEWLDTL